MSLLEPDTAHGRLEKEPLTKRRPSGSPVGAHRLPLIGAKERNDRREMAPRRSNRAPPDREESRSGVGAGTGIKWGGLLVSAKELQHVVVPEAPVAASGHPEERDLAAIAQPLDGVHVQVQHLGDFRGREQLPYLVRHHRLRFLPATGGASASLVGAWVRTARLLAG